MLVCHQNQHQATYCVKCEILHKILHITLHYTFKFQHNTRCWSLPYSLSHVQYCRRHSVFLQIIMDEYWRFTILGGWCRIVCNRDILSHYWWSSWWKHSNEYVKLLKQLFINFLMQCTTQILQKVLYLCNAHKLAFCFWLEKGLESQPSRKPTVLQVQ